MIFASRAQRDKKRAGRQANAPGHEFSAGDGYAFQIMSATVLLAGMNGMTCVL
jgi:hypothetical protein